MSPYIKRGCDWPNTAHRSIDPSIKLSYDADGAVRGVIEEPKRTLTGRGIAFEPQRLRASTVNFRGGFLSEMISLVVGIVLRLCLATW